MSQQHTNLDPELQKLQAEGFELEVRDGLIIVHHVPYLNSKQEILDGKLIFCFTSNISTIGKPNDHTAYWEGNKPCCNDGSEVPSLINSYKGCWNGFQEVYYLSLYPDSLPNSRYPDYYTKIKTYYSTIAGHAFAYNANLANTVKYGTVKIVDDDIFVYQDTNSSRAGLLGATAKFQGKKVAIVGLGGTGGYLLDYLAKCLLTRFISLMEMYSRNIMLLGHQGLLLKKNWINPPQRSHISIISIPRCISI